LDSRLDGVDRIQRERAKQSTERAWGANARARRQSFPRVNIIFVSIRGASARRCVGARAPARASTRILSFEDSLLDALTAIEDAVVVVVVVIVITLTTMTGPACAERGNLSRRSVLKNVLLVYLRRSSAH
jgi:hypothetical protein